MSILLAVLSLFSNPAQAAQAEGPMQRASLAWSDIANPGTYSLTQELQINSGMVFTPGSSFYFIEALGGGGYVPVISYKMRALKCLDPEATAEMFLINPTGRNGEEVGVQMEKGCMVEFLVEDKMLPLPSLFIDSAE